MDCAAVVGPGAIGGLLAARLALAGAKVMLVGRNEAWRGALRRKGLRLSSSLSRSTVRIPALDLNPRVRPSGPVCNAVFICVKSQDTRRALAAARPLVGPDTAVVSLQNGLSHVRQALSAFGRRRAVFGVCYVAAGRPAPLHVRHEGGEDILLSPHAGNGPALKTARRWLERAGFTVRTVPSRERLLWTKAVFNAATNPLGALAARTNGSLARDPALKDIMLKTAREASAVAEASGRRPLYPSMDRRLLRSCLMAPNQENSMLQDLRAGRPTEIAAIAGPILAAARRTRTPAPTLEALCRFLKRLEREICRGRSP